MRGTLPSAPDVPEDPIVIVSAFNEADRLPATVDALRAAFPAARIVVADDASTDGTADAARAAGVEVVTARRNIGKGGATTLAAEIVLHRAWEPEPPVFVLCDGDLAASAQHLPALADAVRAGDADLAVAAFERKVGGGFGMAKGFARWAIRRRCGLETTAPISGQRALSGEAFRVAVPFAPRFGMEIGMTVDVERAGLRVREVQLPLAHRATGKSLRGFLHRGRQLKDFLAVYRSRRL
jgi:glycosyltransferase involved in cell wall biosynthesis